MSETKVIAFLIALLALVGVVTFTLRYTYDSGKAAGISFTQAQWDEDKIHIAEVTAVALADQVKKTEDALEANQVIHDQYEAKLKSVQADGLALAIRVRDAERTAAHLSTLSATQVIIGPVTTSAETSVDRLTELLGNTLSECERNADALDALVAEINRQMK